MLEELSVRDFALIDRLDASFSKGLNILTGETGTGKSILIGSIGFLLGDKVDTGIIRKGAEETTVSGVVTLGGSPELRSWLSERGIRSEDNTLVLRRNLKTSGRGSAYIQGTAVARTDLQDFTSFLVDMHGQHEHQSLLNPGNHQKLLDRFAGIEDEVWSYAGLFAALTEKRRELEKKISSEAERSREIDLLEYSIREIESVRLKEGEDEELRVEEKRLAQSEKFSALAETTKTALSEGENSALSLLRKAKQALESAAAIDSGLEVFSKRLGDAYYEIEDISVSVRRSVEAVDFSPSRMEEIEQRLAVIQKLKKKYGNTISEILLSMENSRKKLQSLKNWEEDRASLEKEMGLLEKGVYAKALAISEKRRAAAERLKAEIQGLIRTLGMPKAVFDVSLGKKGTEGGKPVVGQFGIDTVEFLIGPNPGEPVRELRRIASGGELSRIMLAVKTVLARSDSIDTLVFDEIDTGIGGEVAVSVANHLALLAREKQVFCITHLASIAVRADNHIKVEKTTELGRTVTRLEKIEGVARVEEVARMLSGGSGGDASLRHAEELLRQSNSR